MAYSSVTAYIVIMIIALAEELPMLLVTSLSGMGVMPPLFLTSGTNLSINLQPVKKAEAPPQDGYVVLQ